MASVFVEKVQVAVVTATLVSAAWITAGAFLLDLEETAQIEEELAEKRSAEEEDEKASAPAVATPTSEDTREASVPSAGEAANLMIPVLGVSARDLTDTYRDERGGGTRLHAGIDIMAEEGTSVVAAAPGTVERLFNSDAGGITVYVRSEDGQTIYYYAHLAEYAPGLNEGMTVRRGQRLGTVGSSGNADPNAPHLHFEIMRTTAESEWWEPASSVNPYPLLTRQRR